MVERHNILAAKSSRNISRILNQLMLANAFIIFQFIPTISFSASNEGIQNIGTLPGLAISGALGVSGNGQVVVGASSLDPLSPSLAFRWTESIGMQNLGFLNGGPQAIANATNQDGRVVVGEAINGNTNRLCAFRWDASTGLENITPDPNFDSSARGINSDGTVIVGYGAFAGVSQAFRWTRGTGAVSLGDLGGGNSSAYSVSGDGNFIVGESVDINNAPHAFRWTPAGGGTMQDLGVLAGGNFSSARAISVDGNVVVGIADNANNTLAFRWTQASGMVSLGILTGGTFTAGFGVNADGSVIVGSGDTITGNCGFRWTAATGLQTIEEWLTAAGAYPAGSPTTQTATSVSYDGSVVVGTLSTNVAYIARVSPSSNPTIGSGIVAIPDLYNSLASTSSALTLASNSTGLVIHGSHGHPLDNRIYEGCNGFWLSGDWGYFRNKTPNDQRGPTALAELGFSHLFNDYIQAGIGAGRTSSTQHLISNSRIVVNGTYFIAETMTKLSCDVWATLTGYYLFGKEKIQRGYILSGASNSAGNPSVTTPAARARLDWENALCFSRLSLSPYADFSYIRAKLDAYTEHLGSFPSSFAKRRDHSTEARVGINSSLGLGCFNLLGTIEGVHHFERTGIAANGQVLGLFAFNLPGQRIPQNWVRGSIGFKQPLPYGVFTVYLNGATRGLDPRIWAAANYNLSF